MLGRDGRRAGRRSTTARSLARELAKRGPAHRGGQARRARRAGPVRRRGPPGARPAGRRRRPGRRRRRASSRATSARSSRAVGRRRACGWATRCGARGLRGARRLGGPAHPRRAGDDLDHGGRRAMTARHDTRDRAMTEQSLLDRCPVVPVVVLDHPDQARPAGRGPARRRDRRRRDHPAHRRRARGDPPRWPRCPDLHVGAGSVLVPAPGRPGRRRPGPGSSSAPGCRSTSCSGAGRWASPRCPAWPPRAT